MPHISHRAKTGKSRRDPAGRFLDTMENVHRGEPVVLAAEPPENSRPVATGDRAVSSTTAPPPRHAEGPATGPVYSIVIPTYRRGEALSECLESVCALEYPLDDLEVVIVDNGGADHTQAATQQFESRLKIRYLINDRNRGYGYSVNRGMAESLGHRLLMLNDDVRPLPDLLRRCDDLLVSDPLIGCIGCRAIERGYARAGTGIGVITSRGDVVGNFDVDCGTAIEVEHVYGFCYVLTREAVRRVGLKDRTLLSRPYSSGNRIETDYCLSIREHGLKVVYDPRIAAIHLAKPRSDMDEASPRWRRNAIRNSIYLFLKHFGPFGKGAAALRMTFVTDVGAVSMLRHPRRENINYFVHGLGSRVSAWWHWIRYLTTPKRAR
jgi:GT2 family glycosyltransferase